MKKAYIELTTEQKIKLRHLFTAVFENSESKPVMLLAQIHITPDGNAVALCGIVNHEKSMKLQEALEPSSVGKTADHKFAERVLRKARMT